ncbi:hypothetical protein TREMEDRAFT_71451 [Tremella mesenterica DSM 1558]|uniref:uncharacterized protein n=1 Tax=Tremella mesenterica (strain ATCC 24925 / CBS 8224 / DSM 1558 / NBRC 9311 / NRRL Y-6157 / RJB 2259-6 / UBC 559-6) TaxID=578456 RepID=UPI0003F4972E|nr:uncharacterized protein TREMEDRAFT_71451 [Tremella mesenterica DSM 1558]EIW69918.1 hypothetical protein TREMEDRAFT_71451 [Tremella mesenterica DSM 1558]
MSGGFFGFDSALPERRNDSSSQSKPPFPGFQADHVDQAFGIGQGAEEDVAVYTWGQGLDDALRDAHDDFNHETFGVDPRGLGTDFQFAAPKQTAAPSKTSGKPRGPIASTQSRYKPKPVADPFAMSEDDFYSSRVTKSVPKKPVDTKAKPSKLSAAAGGSLWNKPNVAPSQLWGTQPTSVARPEAVAPPGQIAPQTFQRPVGHIKTLEEIEAEMAGIDLEPFTHQPQPPQQPRILSLEEIEREMMTTTPMPPMSQPPPSLPPQPILPPPSLPVQSLLSPPSRPDSTPTVPLPGSGYASGHALLDSIFPQLGATPRPDLPPAHLGPASEPPLPPQPSPEELARLDALRKRVAAKIESMSRYNHTMGSSDKDYITRMQLSQLVTDDPYTSDFYAQVFSAIKRSRLAAEQADEKTAVVQIAPGAALSVSAPTESRFGKMGSKTMQRLSTQVKRLVDSRAAHKKTMDSATLKGALGRVSRSGIAAPRPVLAVPVGSKPEHRPTSALNQTSGVHRPALTRKQVMYALEEMYDLVLELEQLRRTQPSPESDEMKAWDEECQLKVEEIWRRLMVMEPLDVSTPHPFISLLNAVKGQRLMPRVLRHLPHSQALTLLTLLIATYPQLDVIAHAPPPPVADASLLNKMDRVERARREAETDCFLQCVVPGMDMLISTCNLGLVAGLLNICTQKMPNLKQVASTRPGVALFTALLSRAQSLIRVSPADPNNPQPIPGPDPAEVDHWQRTFAYFLHLILPHLPELFPASVAQKAAFGPGAYLLGGEGVGEKESLEMERREAEVWGLAAALAVNAPEEEQTNLVAALRDKILHTVQGARNPVTPPFKAEMRLRNVNMFLHGLGLDASMIE